MAKIDRKARWSSGMDLLNVIMPATVAHKQILAMNRALHFSDFKFRPLSDEAEEAMHPMCVRDIVEFFGNGVRFIMMEDENGDYCQLRVEFISPDRQPIDGERFALEMREAR